MKHLLLPAAAMLVLAGTASARAEDQAAEGAAPSGGQPVRLIAFDGGREFLSTSSRLRVWRSEVAYRLSVDAAGTPTDCELADKFRRSYVNQQLCEVLMKHHSFEPARDASGTPVEGSYSGNLNYEELREKD